MNARGIPFLRIKKPQPQNLSRVIKQKLDRRWKWIQRRDNLEMELLYAKDEDEWDTLVDNVQNGRQDDENLSWTDCVQQSLDETVGQIFDFDKKTSDIAEAMWNVVLEERKLAEKEEAERKNRRSEKQISQDETNQRSAHKPGGTDQTSSTIYDKDDS